MARLISIMSTNQLSQAVFCRVKPIGLMPMIDQGESDDKQYTNFKELPPHRLAEIRRFFEDCILAPPL
ncbi:hypothetical protein Nepgr_002196 [Nepenthes gracilis]|uniref:inorganic diphosphatase n=1 Tax=Nepenthes gracilis TaxID=150966 RepID=A0AAD3P6M6_NEPGR|nr:hypothetical protein Nepgr_002196 [Nepenthes gracilis]